MSPLSRPRWRYEDSNVLVVKQAHSGGGVTATENSTASDRLVEEKKSSGDPALGFALWKSSDQHL